MNESSSNKIIFNRKDRVNYKPAIVTINDGRAFEPVNGTYIWASLVHDGFKAYVIQHADGFPKSHFIKDYLEGKFPDGFEAVHSKDLKDGLKYIWADEAELELINSKTQSDTPKETMQTPIQNTKKPQGKSTQEQREPVKKIQQALAPINFHNINISQSLVKSLYDYSEGKLCGLQFEAQYIKKIPFPPSAVQKVGNYFEYMCTGAIPRDGKIPEPERKKDKIEKIITKGKKLKNGNRAKDKIEKKVIPGELAASYARMAIQADRFKRTIKSHGIKILKTGAELKYTNKKGVTDVLARIDGKEAIIDIKSSGLIGNKWEDLGWDIDALPEKDKIMIQPVFYKWLWRKIYGRDIPFYFLVFSNTNEYDCLFLEVVIDEDRFSQFEKALEKVEKMLNKNMTEGFKAYPDVKECADCPLKKTCPSFIDIPLLQTVHY